ncbi:hypothetical protein [Thermogutta sp.]|uniref:hypothetical protein n=1 Tax=Thermogutta sp. TaxID=1962930 RepID=UPI0032204359
MITFDLSVRFSDTEPFPADYVQTLDWERTGTKILAVSKTVGTTAITISLADLTQPGYAFFKNMSSQGNIDVGYNDGSQRSLIRLAPGQFALCPLKPGITLGAQADQAGCVLLAVVYEA